MGFGHCLASQFPRIPTVCHGHPVQSFCDHPCMQASFHPRLAAKSLRRDGDSNPGNPFGVYTLSRRASSTTRASLHCVRRQIASPHDPKNEHFQGTHKGDFSKSATKLLQIIHIRKFFGNYFLFCYIFSSIICIYQKKTLTLHPE